MGTVKKNRKKDLHRNYNIPSATQPILMILVIQDMCCSHHAQQASRNNNVKMIKFCYGNVKQGLIIS